uniref:Uncharacterized protein n=1 Tax=Setaria italica TaxID=4555 RepID=K3YFL1_SETIT
MEDEWLSHVINIFNHPIIPVTKHSHPMITNILVPMLTKRMTSQVNRHF